MAEERTAAPVDYKLTYVYPDESGNVGDILHFIPKGNSEECPKLCDDGAFAQLNILDRVVTTNMLEKHITKPVGYSDKNAVIISEPEKVTSVTAKIADSAESCKNLALMQVFIFHGVTKQNVKDASKYRMPIATLEVERFAHVGNKYLYRSQLIDALNDQLEDLETEAKAKSDKSPRTRSIEGRSTYANYDIIVDFDANEFIVSRVGETEKVTESPVYIVPVFKRIDKFDDLKKRIDDFYTTDECVNKAFEITSYEDVPDAEPVVKELKSYISSQIKDNPYFAREAYFFDMVLSGETHKPVELKVANNVFKTVESLPKLKSIIDEHLFPLYGEAFVKEGEVKVNEFGVPDLTLDDINAVFMGRDPQENRYTYVSIMDNIEYIKFASAEIRIANETLDTNLAAHDAAMVDLLELIRTPEFYKNDKYTKLIELILESTMCNYAINRDNEFIKSISNTVAGFKRDANRLRERIYDGEFHDTIISGALVTLFNMFKRTGIYSYGYENVGLYTMLFEAMERHSPNGVCVANSVFNALTINFNRDNLNELLPSTIASFEELAIRFTNGKGFAKLLDNAENTNDEMGIVWNRCDVVLNYILNISRNPINIVCDLFPEVNKFVSKGYVIDEEISKKRIEELKKIGFPDYSKIYTAEIHRTLGASFEITDEEYDSIRKALIEGFKKNYGSMLNEFYAIRKVNGVKTYCLPKLKTTAMKVRHVSKQLLTQRILEYMNPIVYGYCIYNADDTGVKFDEFEEYGYITAATYDKLTQVERSYASKLYSNIKPHLITAEEYKSNDAEDSVQWFVICKYKPEGIRELVHDAIVAFAALDTFIRRLNIFMDMFANAYGGSNEHEAYKVFIGALRAITPCISILESYDATKGVDGKSMYDSVPADILRGLGYDSVRLAINGLIGTHAVVEEIRVNPTTKVENHPAIFVPTRYELSHNVEEEINCEDCAKFLGANSVTRLEVARDALVQAGWNFIGFISGVFNTFNKNYNADEKDEEFEV